MLYRAPWGDHKREVKLMLKCMYDCRWRMDVYLYLLVEDYVYGQFYKLVLW